jgi:hypothetical protein
VCFTYFKLIETGPVLPDFIITKSDVFNPVYFEQDRTSVSCRVTNHIFQSFFDIGVTLLALTFTFLYFKHKFSAWKIIILRTSHWRQLEHLPSITLNIGIYHTEKRKEKCIVCMYIISTYTVKFHVQWSSKYTHGSVTLETNIVWANPTSACLFHNLLQTAGRSPLASAQSSTSTNQLTYSSLTSFLRTIYTALFYHPQHPPWRWQARLESGNTPHA